MHAGLHLHVKFSIDSTPLVIHVRVYCSVYIMAVFIIALLTFTPLIKVTTPLFYTYVPPLLQRLAYLHTVYMTYVCVGTILNSIIIHSKSAIVQKQRLVPTLKCFRKNNDIIVIKVHIYVWFMPWCMLAHLKDTAKCNVYRMCTTQNQEHVLHLSHSDTSNA